MGASQSEEMLWTDDPEIRRSKGLWRGERFIAERTKNCFRVTDDAQGDKKMHFRLIFPDLPASEFASQAEIRDHIRGVILFFHGYAGHINSAGIRKTLQRIATESKCVIVTPDSLGHGFSEGIRALITSPEGPVQNHLHLLSTVLFDEDSERLCCDDSRLKVLRTRWADDCPLYFMGFSFGGAYTLMATLAMEGFGLTVGTTPTKTWPNLAARFRGSILLSPLCDGVLPNPAVVGVLKQVVARMIPHAQIPNMFERAQNPAANTRDKEQGELFESDGWMLGGIGWCMPMRFRTAATSVDIIYALRGNDALSRIKSPMLLMMDPEDEICLYSGVQRVKEHAQNAELVPIPDGLHDILCNTPDVVVSNITRWIEGLS